MKRHFFTQIITVVIVSVVLCGCNRPGKKSGETTTGEQKSEQVKVFDDEKIKTQLIEIIRESPKPVQIMNVMNEAGASYISDLTLQQDEYEKLMTSTQKALGIGLLAVDGKYAAVYNRPDDFLQVRDNANQFVAALGLGEVAAEAKKFEQRLEQNKSNADSLNYLVTKIFENFHQHMQEDKNADVYAFSFIGANMEALYILSQMTLLAENKEELLGIMNNQHELVEGVASLLEAMSDREKVKPYYDKIQPVITFFEEKETLTTDDLSEVTPLIEEARNSMIRL